jgi:preprotein translocase subunit SecY
MPLYNLLYLVGIIFFCYFYTAIIFNPDDVAENMRKYGGFIPGIRPGKRHGGIHRYDPDAHHAGRRDLLSRASRCCRSS